MSGLRSRLLRNAAAFLAGATACWASAQPVQSPEQATPEPDACVPAEGPHDTRARIVARMQAMGAWAKRTDSTKITGKESLVRPVHSATTAADVSRAAAPERAASGLRLVVEGTTVVDRDTQPVISDAFVPAAAGLPARICARVVS